MGLWSLLSQPPLHSRPFPRPSLASCAARHVGSHGRAIPGLHRSAAASRCRRGRARFITVSINPFTLEPHD